MKHGTGDEIDRRAVLRAAALIAGTGTLIAVGGPAAADEPTIDPGVIPNEFPDPPQTPVAAPGLGIASVPSGSADDLLRVAAGEVPRKWTSTSSKYNDWYGISGYWCAMFVSWCADQSGTLGVIPKHASTRNGADWFQARGQWAYGTSGMRRGDIVYFDFGVGHISHVGMVELANGDGTFSTLEGNTGNESQRSGGWAMRKLRSGTYVVGYGRPAYAGAGLPAPAPTPSAPKLDLGDDMRLIRDDSTGTIYAAGMHNLEPVTSMERYYSLAAVYGAYVNLSGVDFARVRDQVNENIVAFARSLKGQNL